ncbi:MAG: bifunctional 3'-5' exonuclease/DNA polymerase, partial [Lacisediminihabitans sp.]
MYVALFESPHGAVLQPLDESGDPTGERRDVGASALAGAVAELEAGHPRWVWDDTTRWYPRLLAEGVRVERCVDLRLSHAILRSSALTATSELAIGAVSSWDRPAPETVDVAEETALFDLDEPLVEPSDEDTLAEFALQRAAIA